MRSLVFAQKCTLITSLSEHAHVMDKFDSVLSRSDIYYITHVGGILCSSHQRFCSYLFNIFDIDDVVTKLAHCDTAVRTQYVLPVTSPVSHLTQTSLTTHSVQYTQYTLSVYISSYHSSLCVDASLL